MNLKGTYMGELGAGEEREEGNNIKQFYKEIFHWLVSGTYYTFMQVLPRW